MVSGKDLEKEFKEEEINCFKNFKYNLKYIYKYIKFKSDFEKKNINLKNIDEKNSNKKEKSNICESNIPINNEINNAINSGEKEDEKTKKMDEDTPEIIEKFYEECHNHIKQKITGFYSMSENESVTVEEYKRLKELRDIIFNKELFTIEEIRNEIKYYPAKYLNIFQNKTKNIQTFQIKFSNIFFKLAVNNLLNKLEDEIQALNRFVKGSGGGINFESNVINSILHCKEQVFGQLKYKKRIVFSLVGKTENSKNIVKAHRNEEENNRLFKYYNIKEYSENIDDTDFEKDINKIKLTENLYLIMQASKTGRSFDFAILKKYKEPNEWNLYLFQTTINKKSELKSKNTYVSDSIVCESYLSSLYKIKIKNTYLTFVIPFNNSDYSFTSELEKRKIHYIYYKSCQFYDIYDNLISNLNFVGAEITKKERKDIDEYQIKIEKSLNAWEISVNKFLKRKRERDLSGYYSRCLSKIKGRGIKLNIPSEIKDKIFATIYGNHNENEFELLFIGNCKIENIKNVFNNNTLLIFFKIKDGCYFYFENYYKLLDDSFVKIQSNQLPKEKGFNSKLKYEKNIIDLKEINDKINLSFCYKILGENN